MRTKVPGVACQIVESVRHADRPELAARVMGAVWPALAGTRIAHTALRDLTKRIARGAGGNRNRALAIVGDALMNADERIAFMELARGSDSLLLFRFTDLSVFTGWYESRDNARAQWTHHKPARVLQTTTVDRSAVLAVKQNDGRTEIVLVPNCAAERDVTWENL